MNMNAIKFYLFLGITGFVMFYYSSNLNFKPEKKPLNFKSGDNYTKEWATIDSLESQGLPKSALEIVVQIYEHAKKEQNHAQYIKALIYKMKYKNGTEDDSYETLIYELKNEIIGSKFPDNAVMHSVLAEMYWNYYINNRWKFYNRTVVVNASSDDIKTWDLNRLATEVIKEYNLSLENKDSLQLTKNEVYEAIITRGTKKDNLRPTLYDFLAFRAITFFSNKEASLTRPADKFELKEDFYFSNATDFSKLKITTNDTLSLQFYAFKLYQNLLTFRLQDKNIDALIDLDLSRIKFIYNNSVSDLKDSLYLNSLENLLKKFESVSFSGYISYDIADYYFSKSSNYNPLVAETNKFENYKITAHKICEGVMSKFPKTDMENKCSVLLKKIEMPTLSFETDNNVIPNEKFAVKINYRNLSKVYIKIGLIDSDKLMKIKEKYYNTEELYQKLFDESKEVLNQSVELPIDIDYNPHSLEYIINPLTNGVYVIFMADNAEFKFSEKSAAYDFINSTFISYTYRNKNNGNFDFFVSNRKTGEVMPGVTAQLWVNKYNYTLRKYVWVSGGKYTTDVNGYFEVMHNTDIENYSFYIEFHKDKDNLLTDNSYYSYNHNYNQPTTYSTHIFSDRAIYRPGQTVYFKAIVLEHNGEEKKIATKFNQNVILYDVNYQKIADLNLTTNDFGSYNGSFVIPTGLLNGNMQIYTNYGSIYISVEEYKRPKFEVEVLPLKGNYLLNQDVEVKGKAVSYSGAGLTDAVVKYRVVRTPMWRGWWYSYYNAASTEIISDTVSTKDNGEFSFKFNALPDLSYPKNNFTVFSYSVVIDVTDINGETQSTSKQITVGYTALNVSLEIPEVICSSEKDTFNINTYNLNGEFVTANGNIKIFKLKTNASLLKSKTFDDTDKKLYSQEEWNKQFAGNEYKNETEFSTFAKEKQVYDLTFNTEKQKKIKLNNLNKVEQGVYKVEITSKDFAGNPVSDESYFTVFAKDNNKMPYETYDWFNTSSYIVEPGDNADFYIGSSASDVKVMVEIESKNKIIDKYWITLNNEKKLISIPVKEEYRGNFTAHFNFINNNRRYTHVSLVSVPFTNKQIDIKFETFRNKLQPGENEEWKLKLSGKNGEKIAAEMLATLYDASLDAFKKNYWYFNVWDSYYTTMSLNTESFNTTTSTYLGVNEYSLYYYEGYYDRLNWFEFNYYAHYGYYRSEGRTMKSSAYKSKKDGESAGEVMAEESENMPATFALDDVMAKSPVTDSKMDSDKDQTASQTTTTGDSFLDLEKSTGKKEDNKSHESVKVRTNFNETAFFYPSLVTNEKGEIIVKFTVPESLTKWKMMGLAHTKDLKTGYSENTLITQKELMVVPNATRFFRENDEMEFPVKISNVSEKALSGTAILQFFDALTMKPVDGIFDAKETTSKDFSVDAGKNTMLSWKIKIPEGIGAISYRVTAKSGNQSDGEENAVPVLTNRMLVTETMPLPIRGKTTKTFTFQKLLDFKKSSTLRNHKLTLEFTSNPAWYAIQSLPYLFEYPYECAEQTFSRFYANSIASHIANSSPKIKRVFDSWKNTPDSKSLLSNLEKNQELKSLMLEETPWVLDAKDESERKRRVGLLFDLNKMSSELESAIKKLMKMQVSNGGWPWFEGMPESRYITQHVVNGMGKLDKLGVTNIRQDGRVWEMVTKAISYLDDRIDDDYKWLKKHYTESEMKEDHIGDLQIHYLYARSFFKDVKISNRNSTAFEYYKAQAEKYWLNKSKYLQGLIALALHRNENTVVPPKIVKSLKEFSIDSEEMGMYWKDNSSGYYWYQAPIEFQALMIELFDEVANDEKSVNDLKVWLLKNKQTNDWKTTRATVEAVYALLMRGTDWLENDEMVEITVGDKKLDPLKDDNVKVEAGTGYFKTSWSGDEIKPEMANVKLVKNTEGVSWGGMYWQYFEQLDKITPHETPLKINKKLFIEKNSGSGKIIDPISEKNKLKVGDKIIVRIELRVDRDMEYVHMKDMRASCLEPVNVISRYKYQDGLGYYESTKDASTNFFFGFLPKGTYVFEYPLLVSHKGDFSNGITSIQCMYAPEFASHSEGIRVGVE